MAKNRIKVPSTMYPVDLRKAVSIFQCAYLRDALAAHDGNISMTAKALGISRRTLQLKLRRTATFFAQSNQETHVASDQSASAAGEFV